MSRARGLAAKGITSSVSLSSKQAINCNLHAAPICAGAIQARRGPCTASGPQHSPFRRLQRTADQRASRFFIAPAQASAVRRRAIASAAQAAGRRVSCASNAARFKPMTLAAAPSCDRLNRACCQAAATGIAAPARALPASAPSRPAVGNSRLYRSSRNHACHGD